MSWYKLGEKKQRKGVMLRYRSLPPKIALALQKKARRFWQPLYVIIKEKQGDDMVLLEAWYSTLTKGRFVVTHLSVKEDPEWVCEGE